ncbi:hypothetical protein BH09PLA1_BH09PLA1_21520 [soil metagenome]
MTARMFEGAGNGLANVADFLPPGYEFRFDIVSPIAYHASANLFAERSLHARHSHWSGRSG